MRDFADEYAVDFQRRVVMTESPSDVHIEGTAYREILCCMAAHHRELVGLVALLSIRERRFGNSLWQLAPVRTKLANEVRSGTCTLAQDADGMPERIVRVTQLRLTNQDGLVLVKLAKADKRRKLVPATRSRERLPGTAQRNGEDRPEKALEHYLQQQFPGLSDCLLLEDMETDVVEVADVATSFKMKTTYVITIYTKVIKEGASLLYDGDVQDGNSAHMTSTLPPRTRQETEILDGLHNVCVDASGNVYAWVGEELFQDLQDDPRVVGRIMEALSPPIGSLPTLRGRAERRFSENEWY